MAGGGEPRRRLQRRGGEGLVAPVPAVLLERQLLLVRPCVESPVRLEGVGDHAVGDAMAGHVEEAYAGAAPVDLRRPPLPARRAGPRHHLAAFQIVSVLWWGDECPYG